MTYQNSVELQYSRAPVELVKLTVKGDLSGSQLFRFSSKDADLINLQIGQDVRPYILDVSGRPTRILADQAVTERANITLRFADDLNPPPFDSSVFSITTGGTFWKRLILAQEDIVGSEIEVLRGFIENGYLESAFQTIFKGRVEDYSFNNDGTFNIKAKDILILIAKDTPSEISDDNLVNGAIGINDSTFTVDTGSEITDSDALPNKDYAPVVIRLDPDTAAEDVIINSVSANIVKVQANHLQRSEDMTNSIWNKSSGIIILAEDVKPPVGGPETADSVDFTILLNLISQQSTITPANETWTFSVWLKAPSTRTVTLRLRDNGGGVNIFENQVTVEPFWKRFEVTAAFTGAATDPVQSTVFRDTGDGEQVWMWGTQLEQNSVRGFYVATTDAASTGTDAGRGAYDSTQAAHADDIEFTEAIIYRNQLTEDGITPIMIVRDLVTRAGVPDVNVDEAIFGNEFEVSGADEFRRGNASGFVDTTIIEPESILDLMKEVKQQGVLDVWVGELGLVKAKSSLTIRDGDSVKFINDTNTVVDKSFQYQGNTVQRVTRIFVYFNIKAGKEGDKRGDFDNISITVDIAVEALSGEKPKSIFSKWIFRLGEAGNLGQRTISRFKRGNIVSKMQTELKDDIGLVVGSIVALTTDDFLVATSGGSVTRGNTMWQVTSKSNNRMTGQIGLEMSLISNKKICFIAPAVPPSGSFPTEYDDANEEDKIFCWIGRASDNKLGTALDDGYVIL